MKLYSRGTILLPKSGASTFLNHRVIMGADGYVSSHLATIQVNEEMVNGNFLFYFLQLIKAQDLIQDHKYPSLNLSVISEIEIPLPPLPEQKRLVALFDELFEKLEIAKENAKKNLENAKELFDSYLQDIFNNSSSGWEKKRLQNICENLDKKRIPITKKDRIEGEIPYYGASGIVDYVNEYIFDENILLVSEDGANLLARTYPIAFSVSGKCWVNNHAHVLRFSEKITQEFVEYYLNSISLVDYISGMAQPKLNQSSLNSIKIPLPTIVEQKRIINELHELSLNTNKLTSIYNQKLDNLEELKKSILQKAFVGEL